MMGLDWRWQINKCHFTAFAKNWLASRLTTIEHVDEVKETVIVDSVMQQFDHLQGWVGVRS